MDLLAAIAVAFLTTLALTPLVIKFAPLINAVDYPDERKVHSRVMPLMGGLSIFIGFWTAVFLTQQPTMEIWGFFIGSIIIITVGIIDDIKGVSPGIKFLFQGLAACCAMSAGIKVYFVTNVFFGGMLSIGWITYPLTFLWVVGVTNAVNLVDGLDGLAAGISAIAALTIGIISWMNGLPLMGALALILAASIIAFLKYNFHPANVFMGDTGSLFLGYSLSILAIIGLTKTVTVISLFLPIVILGIPIFDTAFAILRRLSSHKPIFSPDKDHLHHRLMAVGLTYKTTVLIIYGFSVLLGASAIVMSILTTAQGMIVMTLVLGAMFYMANRIGVLSRESAKTRIDVR